MTDACGNLPCSFTAPEKLAIIDIFQDEILQNTDFIEKLEHCFQFSGLDKEEDIIVIGEIRGEFFRNRQRCQAVLLKFLYASKRLENTSLLYDYIVEQCEGKNAQKLQEKMRLVELNSGNAEKLRNILKCFKSLKQLISAKSVVLEMEKIPTRKQQYANILTPLRKAANSPNYDDDNAMRELLRKLPYLSASSTTWYYDFVKCVEKTSFGKALVNKKLHPNFKQDYDDHFDKVKREQEELLRKRQMNLSKRAEIKEAKVKSLRPPELARTLIHYHNEKVKIASLNLRNYQLELAEKAVCGENTIITAPTGSGKTIVAAYIAQKHFAEGRKRAQLRRMAFFVPTVPLVNQQKELFEKYLADYCRIIGISGGERRTPPSSEALKYHIVVLTPQIMINMLDNFDNPLILSDFTLWIFDECHHATESHPYNMLMRTYHDFRDKNAGAVPSAETLATTPFPHVVGLTASLGVGGGGTNDDQSREHIAYMGANLAAESLTQIVSAENKQELMRHVNAPDDQLELVESDHLNEPYWIHVKDLIATVEAQLKPLLEYVKDSGSAKSAALTKQHFEIPKLRALEQYIGWLSQLKQKVPLLRDSDTKREILKCLEHLRVYINALELALHLPNMHSYAYLLDRMDQISCSVNQSSEIDQTLLQKFNAKQQFLEEAVKNQQQKKIVVKLRQILKGEYDTNANSRAIVFVRTRLLALELMKHLETYPIFNFNDKAVGVGYLTSVNQSAEKVGQSWQEQQYHLAKFRSGETKVLIATSVAEEGLDIAQCNLIIKYNHVSNEIAMVQRRGRGRAMDSRSVLIAQEGRIAEKELQNMKKEALMDRALLSIRDRGPAWFKEQSVNQVQVKKKMKDIKLDREINRNLKVKNYESIANCRWELRCRQCNAFISASEDVRRIQSHHYVCVDTSIWHRANFAPKDRATIHGDAAVVGEMSCANSDCRLKWGPLFKYRDVYLPGLKAEAFVAVGENAQNGAYSENDGEEEEKKLAKKWKQLDGVLFHVEPIERYDLCRMKQSLDVLSFNSVTTTEDESENVVFDVAVYEKHLRDAENRLEREEREKQLVNSNRRREEEENRMILASDALDDQV